MNHSVEAELEAIGVCCKALEGIPIDGRIRAVRFLDDKYVTHRWEPICGPAPKADELYSGDTGTISVVGAKEGE